MAVTLLSPSRPTKRGKKTRQYAHYTVRDTKDDVIRVLFKAQWLLYLPPGLTFTNPTFCPHSVFMCLVWISEQAAIISLYSIN